VKREKPAKQKEETKFRPPSRRSLRTPKKRAASPVPEVNVTKRRSVIGKVNEDDDEVEEVEDDNFQEKVLNEFKKLNSLQAQTNSLLKQVLDQMGKHQADSIAQAAKVIADVFSNMTRSSSVRSEVNRKRSFKFDDHDDSD
jgi:ElaB/YqjD/DUF883 family membrane-anchored ribosome-binding protein